MASGRRVQRLHPDILVGAHWEPTFAQAGAQTTTFRVRDGKGSEDTVTVSITVRDGNRPLKFAAVAAQPVDEYVWMRGIVWEGYVWITEHTSSASLVTGTHLQRLTRLRTATTGARQAKAASEWKRREGAVPVLVTLRELSVILLVGAGESISSEHYRKWRRDVKAELVESGREATLPELAGLDGLVGAWLEEVRSRTGSERTPKEYARILARFFERAGDGPTATAAHVHAFAYGPGPRGDFRAKERPSASTVTVRLAALRSFYDFARRMGAPVSDPTVDVRRPKKAAATPRGLSPEEMRRLLAAIPDSRSGKRDRAAILMMALTGLRRAEVLNIRAGDLSRNGGVYLTWRAKGGKVRRRELPAPAFREIIAALEAEGRPLAELLADARLFEVSSSGFAQNLHRYAVKAGLNGVTPHTLRHTAAKLRRDTGATLEDVSGFLGHGDLATTARYLKRLEGEEDAGWRAAAALIGVE